MAKGKARVMFSYPWGDRDWVGHVIDDVEGPGFDPRHVAGFACGGLIEARWYGVAWSPADKYVNRKHEILSIEVPHLEHIELAARLIRGRRYSYLSCFYGLLRDKFKINLPYSSALKGNCSETWTILLQCGGLPMFDGDAPAGITPADLRRLGAAVESRNLFCVWYRLRSGIF